MSGIFPGLRADLIASYFFGIHFDRPRLDIDYVEYAVSLYITFGLIVGLTARRRGRSFYYYFFLSLTATPVLAFILLRYNGYRFRGEISVPERLSSEGRITEWQQTQLRQLGVSDPDLLQNLGRAQAQVVLAQVQRQTEYVGFIRIFLLFLVGMGAVKVVHYFYQDQGPQLPRDSGSAVTASTSSPPHFAAPLSHLPPGAAPTSAPAPAPAPRPGMLTFTRTVIIPVRYGKVTIPAGTQVAVVSVSNGQVAVRYGGNVVTVPASATNFGP